MKKFAVILSGCGQHDGSETHEVILTLLSMSQEGIVWEAFCPDIFQSRVINHVTNKEESGEKRSILKEAARLVRGKIKPITEVKVSDFDAIVFPGGIGAVENLCNWSTKGIHFEIIPDVKKMIDQAVELKKPMGFICIAPIMIPKIYRDAKLTIGTDQTIAKQIHEMGSQHINCSAADCVVDAAHKVVSTPANMLAKDITEVYSGIKKLIGELKAMS